MRKRDGIRWALLSLLLSSGARAEGPKPRVIWYRASDECPRGPEFIGKLAERASLARLAEAGDHIDFVVTLQAAGGETVGRLERQTESGTVAIRELRDASCQGVADALALSLGLSLEPASEPLAPTEPSLPPSPANPAPPADPAPTTQRVPDHPQPSTGSVNHQRPAATEQRSENEVRSAWLGVQGGAIAGIAPSALVRSALSLSIEDPWPALIRGSALRFATAVAFGSSETSIGKVRRSVLAGRVEACPTSWGRTVNIAPCLGFELGATSAASPDTSVTSDVGAWVAAAAGLRGTLRLAPRFALEAQTEALFPLLRNDVYAGPEAVYRAQSVAFQGGLGVSLRVW